MEAQDQPVPSDNTSTRLSRLTQRLTVKTLKDLKKAVALATHIKLVDSDVLHRLIGVERAITLVNDAGFCLASTSSGPESYMLWPEPSELRFSKQQPTVFVVHTRQGRLAYELI